MSAKISTDEQMVDCNAPDTVRIEISSDGKKIWVNVDGVCRFRAQDVAFIGIEHPKGFKFQE